MARPPGGPTLEPGTTIETGADAHVVLKSAKDNVTVSPKSRLPVPEKKVPGKGANFLESLGTILFDIEYNPSRHFEVDTRYLAEMVKGTAFTVTIGREGGAVQVMRSAVQVASSLSPDLALIRPGQIALVPAKPGAHMTITAHGHTMLAPRTGKFKAGLQEPDYEPSDAATKSHGLGRTIKASNGADDGTLVLTHGLGQQKVDVVKATHGLVTNSSSVTLPSASTSCLGSQAPNAINDGNGNGISNALGNVQAGIAAAVHPSTVNPGHIGTPPGQANGNGNNSSHGNGKDH